MEYHYTNNDRLMQLNDLKGRLTLLIAHLQLNHNDAKIISIYECALFDVDELICNGFNQNQLSNVSDSIPDLFNRHKDWVPPLEAGSDGKLSEPQWFLALENYLQPVLKSARKLKELGAR
ncbi:TPA: hypothetical protein P0E37_005050 [Vibrio campbellii]|uniref:hypothetical protein n=1 Tax=Vibrio campbellii TaxID=680 RepID=UPI000CD35D1B|nr:hypothetical protein [Vibrio campbellii]AUW04775.1 hypothetical protein C1N51_14300 [Vibrio campbellii]HDM8230506.1 hypothetical protein [Vibrio campbellii]